MFSVSQPQFHGASGGSGGEGGAGHATEMPPLCQLPPEVYSHPVASSGHAVFPLLSAYAVDSPELAMV